MLNSITLLGSSSGRNAGDAALISGIMEAVDRACGVPLRYEVPTIRPGYIGNLYGARVQPVAILPWNFSLKMLGLPTYRSLMRTDLSLVFDAILFDRALFNPLFNFLSTLYLLMPRAKKAGKKMGFFNVGTGPVRTPLGRRMLRELSEMMDFITVRDQDSYDILREIGVQNPRVLVTADAALNVQAAPAEVADQVFARFGFAPGQEVLGINVNTYIDSWSGAKTPSLGRDRFVAIYCAALNRVVREIQAPLLFVVTQHSDLSISQEVMARVITPGLKRMITNFEFNHHEIKAVLSRISLLFGMRLHAMILASSELTPIAGLAYQPKCVHYFKTIGLPERIMSFEEFNEEALAERMLRAWADRAQIRARLQERIPVLQAEAYKAGELVAAIHHGEDLDRIFGRLRS